MAIVRLSALLTSITGKYAGGEFHNWNGRTVLSSLKRTMPNHNTVDQVRYRGVVASVSKAWSTLSLSEQDAWGTVAVYLTNQWDNYENEVGTCSLVRTPRGPFSGISALISCHVNLNTIGLWDSGDPLISAPVGVTAPAPVKIWKMEDRGSFIRVWYLRNYIWGNNGTEGFYRLFAKSLDKVFYPQFVQRRSPIGFYVGIRFLRSRGNRTRIPITTGTYFAQVDAVNAQGLRSPPSNIGRVMFTVP